MVAGSQALKARDAGLVLAASVAFATSGPAAKVALVDTHPLVVAAGRCAIAAVAILLVSRGAVLAAFRALGARERRIVLGAGVVLALHFALFIAGLGGTSFAAAVTLVSLEPVAVLVAALAFFGIVPTRIEQLGVLLAAAGALVVALGGSAEGGAHRLSGDLMVTCAVALYGVYYAAARALRRSIEPLPYAAIVYGVAAVVLTLASVAFQVPARAPSGRALVAISVLGVVPTLGGHTLVQIAARRLRPAVVALVSPGETIGSVLIGAVGLGLFPSASEAIGGVAVVAGATLAILGARGAADA